MKKMRILARLDIKGQDVINTIHLEGLRKVGTPNSLAKTYFDQGVDEVLMIDNVASLYGRGHTAELIRSFGKHLFVPLTVGGGVASVDDARSLLRSGADKVAVNTAALKRPELISELATEFGTQCVVLSIQAKSFEKGVWEALYEGGRERSGISVGEWAKKAVGLGAGELLLTSVDRDGTRRGFDVDLLEGVRKEINVPIIMSGGFGKLPDALPVASVVQCEALAVADFLHAKRGSIGEIKRYLHQRGFQVRATF